MHVEHDAVAHLARVQADLGDLVPADALDVADDDERPADRVDRACARSAPSRERLHALEQLVADRARRRRRRRAPTRSRARTASERSSSSIARGRHAARDEVERAVVEREHEREQRRLLGRARTTRRSR